MTQDPKPREVNLEQLVRKSRNPFALPRGMLGRLAGNIMARTDDQHREIVALLDPEPGARICEIGYGPGQLIRLLTERDRSLRIAGVDPSRVMRDQAIAANRGAVAEGRVDLRLGAAAALPFADASFDIVLAVNNAPIWPDLCAGLREMRRVLRPSGRALIAWHSATSPRFIRRRLALSEPELARLEASFNEHLVGAKRHELTYSVIWTGRRATS